MGDDGSWVRVGGKGRPRRTPEQQEQHLREREAAAKVLASVAHHHGHHHGQQQHHGHDHGTACGSSSDDDDADGGGGTEHHHQQQQQHMGASLPPPPPPQQQQQQQQQQQPLPGWGPPPEREWKVAASSRRKRTGRQQLPATPEEQAAQLAGQVRELAEQLTSAPVFSALLAAMEAAAAGGGAAQGEGQGQQQQQQQRSGGGWDWGAVRELVVYGLGSPEDSRVSRHQLALVMLLRRLLPGLSRPPLLYDPAFTDLDALLLGELGLSVIGSNEEGRRAVGATQTLFYLPHCEGALCDNLLEANWPGGSGDVGGGGGGGGCCADAGLPRLAILGNSFATYAQRWAAPPGSRPRTRRPDRLLQLVEAGLVAELPVPDRGFHVASAFNDMSLHTFAAAAGGLGAAAAATAAAPVGGALAPAVGGGG